MLDNPFVQKLIAKVDLLDYRLFGLVVTKAKHVSNLDVVCVKVAVDLLLAFLVVPFPVPYLQLYDVPLAIVVDHHVHPAL